MDSLERKGLFEFIKKSVDQSNTEKSPDIATLSLVEKETEEKVGEKDLRSSSEDFPKKSSQQESVEQSDILEKSEKVKRENSEKKICEKKKRFRSIR